VLRVVPSLRLPAAVAVVAALLVSGTPATAQQSEGAASGDPVPLLPPTVGTGTLDPDLGELEQPATPGFDAPMPAPGTGTGTVRNPDLGAPRVIGAPPGSAPRAPETAPPVETTPPPSAATSTASQGSTDPADAEVLARARGAVADATATVHELRTDSGFTEGLNDFLSRARAVVVVPSFFRAGFVVGAAYGTGLLLVRDDAGTFSDPAFLTLTAGSLGLQAGAQDAEIILMIMTDAGLRAILKDKFKLEAGASVTFGLGGGLSTGSTTDVNQDIVAFSHSKGLFGGGALEGAVIEPRAPWNAAYYDAPGVTPEAIVLERRVSNPTSQPLIEALSVTVPGGK